MAPINNDIVGCASIYEIRETQNPAQNMNNFRSGAAQQRSTQYQGAGTQDMPFHISSVTQTNLNAQNAQFVSEPAQPTVLNTLSSNAFNMGDSNEMDLTPDGNADQPSPATTASNTRSHSLSQSGAAASGSHSSYSPAQPVDQIPYRPSPQMANQTPGQSTSPLNNMYYATANDMVNVNFGFSNANGMPGVDAIGSEFAMNMGFAGDWEMGNHLGSGPAMAPMSEGAWNQMLENMNMGWESVGPPHVDASSAQNH